MATAVLRASLPLELFDRALYAHLTGKLLAPSFLLLAAAPWCYALARESWGDRGLLGLCLLVSLGVTLAALGVLGRRAPACALVRATGELTYRTHYALGAVLELGDAGGLGCL